MDRQRATVIGVTIAVVALLLVGVGVIIGRASAGESTDTETSVSTDSEGLPTGPTGIEDGVPVGFSHDEEGVLGAAVAWVPWLYTSPTAEQPEGIDRVLADGVAPPVPDDLSERLQFVPWAARVSMTSRDEATVTLLGTPLRGNAGDELDGGIWPLETLLVWDDDARDWRVSRFDSTADFIEPPIGPEDVEGFRVLRTYGGVLGGVVVEEVPGD